MCDCPFIADTTQCIDILLSKHNLMLHYVSGESCDFRKSLPGCCIIEQQVSGGIVDHKSKALFHNKTINYVWIYWFACNSL